MLNFVDMFFYDMIFPYFSLMESCHSQEGTTIRLLFQLDVPSGTPPWRLLEDTTDVLYKLPGDGDLGYR